MNRFPYLLLLIIGVTIAGFYPFYASSDQPAVSATDRGSTNGANHLDASALYSKAYALVEKKKEEGTLRERIRALGILRKSGEEMELYGIYDEGLQRGNVLDKMAILEAIAARETTEQDRKILPHLVRDEAYAIRERAVYHLSTSHDTSWRACFREMVKDKDYYVRAGAARALGRCHDREAAPLLLEHMSVETGWTRLCFAQGLAGMGNSEGIRVLRQVSEDASAGKFMVYGLGMRLELGDTSVIAALKRQLSSKDDRVRDIACRYLVRFAPPSEGEIFSQILAQGDILSLRQGLGRMRGFQGERALMIFGGAYERAEDGRKMLFSVFRKEQPDEQLLISTAIGGRFEEVFAAIMENLYLLDRQKATPLMVSLLSREEVKKSPLLLQGFLDVLGRVGEKEDLTILSPFLDESGGTISFSAAGAALDILSRLTATKN
jgi:HEAT repeat protein